ncbi:hypothetical protein EOL73_03555 [Candidatus Saccharibacteria bacterium]|nr:hypothetical protein [Candidatus Saccharibacteria bacterium]NCU40806.1 hypothetical protein [Candidatus Saccharibacteria bacterium]
MNQEIITTSSGDTLRKKENFQMLPGKTLVIGPSRAGKSFYSEAFKVAGLAVLDVDKDTTLIKWRDDITGEPVLKPQGANTTWLNGHHFTIKPKELTDFLSGQGDVIMFAHCWNIMDIVDLFDRVAYMELSPDELDRRLKLERSDHTAVGSPDELEFFRKRHQVRSEQARQHNITFIDATLTPNEFYNELSQVQAK